MNNKTHKMITTKNKTKPSSLEAIEYPFVAIHAVSRDKAAWPEPCLFCQLRAEEKEPYV